MKNCFFPLVLLTVLFSVATSSDSFGWHTASLNNQTIINCLKDKADSKFIVFTAQDKDDHVDPNICESLKFAKDNSIAIRDVKFYPCPNCVDNASKQIQRMLDNLNANCPTLWSGRVWLDLNSHGVWSTPWNQIGKDLFLTHLFFSL